MYTRTFVNFDVMARTASMYCELCGLEADVDIRDDLEDGLSLAAIGRYIREAHTSDGGCDRILARGGKI